MTDLTDKIAALPEMPESITVSDAHRIEPLVIALASRNALLCEARRLRDIVDYQERMIVHLEARNALLCEALRRQQCLCSTDYKCDRCAVLAACEVK